MIKKHTEARKNALGANKKGIRVTAPVQVKLTLRVDPIWIEEKRQELEEEKRQEMDEELNASAEGNLPVTVHRSVRTWH